MNFVLIRTNKSKKAGKCYIGSGVHQNKQILDDSD